MGTVVFLHLGCDHQFHLALLISYYVYIIAENGVSGQPTRLVLANQVKNALL